KKPVEMPGEIPSDVIVLFSKMLWLTKHSRRILRVRYFQPKPPPLLARRWWKYHTSFSFNLL
ncbi:MAG: hypothetical protein KAZ17_00535, partial [Sphingorhabdus sp.]|nr:hypothetical protein [Sphingorhabdus sp.]